MKRILWIVIRALIAVVIVIYLIDWAVLRIRIVRAEPHTEPYRSTNICRHRSRAIRLSTTTWARRQSPAPVPSSRTEPRPAGGLRTTRANGNSRPVFIPGFVSVL